MAHPTRDTSYVISGCAANVSINNGSATTNKSGHGVVITPLPPGSIINKVLLKAVYKNTKKDAKTFTLRNVNTLIVRTPQTLKKEIQRQFKNDICDDFEIGYCHSTNIVTIRKQEDLVEIWNEIKKGQKHVLWCDGLKVSRKRSSPSFDSDDEDPLVLKTKKRKKDDDKEERITQILTKLKEKHGESFTQFQFRIWSEMCAGGIYTSLDEPPNTSMFVRAGGGKSKRGSNDALSGAITQISDAISSLNPKSPSLVSPATICSPVKSIDGRSKCYKQLTELNNLKQSGVLSQEEFMTEKQVIMGLLKKI